MNWPGQWAATGFNAQQWPGFGAPATQHPPQTIYNQFGQPASPSQSLWPFGHSNDNNPTPWRGTSKYTDLHPILAADITQQSYNVTHKPNAAIPSPAYMANSAYQATRFPTTHIRLISPAFPWSIEIMWNTPVTVGMVWEALHAVFQADLEDSEWGMAVNDRKLKATIEKAWRKRIEVNKTAMKLKRVDWLGDAVFFRGLERDEAFEKARLLPGEKPCADTWVVKMGSS